MVSFKNLDRNLQMPILKHQNMTQAIFYDWRSNLEINILINRVLGLWPDGDESFKPGLYVVYSGILVILAACHLLTQTIKLYMVRDDIEALAGTMYITLTLMLAAIKTFFVLVRMKIIKKCFVTLRTNYLFQPRNQNQQLIIQRSVDLWKIMLKVLLGAFSGFTVFVLIPILINSGDKKLPFLAWYPFRTDSFPAFAIACVFQFAFTTYLSLSCIFVDVLVCVFNMYIGCQFDLLSDNLRNLFMKDNTHAEARENLRRCILHHKDILSFVGDYKQFYSGVIFWLWIFSGVSIGITLFQMTIVVPFSIVFDSLISFEIGIILELFLFCYYGNEVQVKSNLVSHAAFESQWPDLPEDIKRSLIIFIINVSKPVDISAFNVFMLNLETFIKVLKTSWSYFALLSQLRA